MIHGFGAARCARSFRFRTISDCRFPRYPQADVDRIDGESVTLLTRSGLDWTAKFKPIEAALKTLKLPSAPIDSEIVVETESGVSSFSVLQQALASGEIGGVVFYAFDLLYLYGKDLRALPLIERKDLLLHSLDHAGPKCRVRFSEHLVEDGAAMARHAC